MEYLMKLTENERNYSHTIGTRGPPVVSFEKQDTWIATENDTPCDGITRFTSSKKETAGSMAFGSMQDYYAI